MRQEEILKQDLARLMHDNQSVCDQSTITFVKLAEEGVIDETTACEHSELFLDWEAGIKYKQKVICRYEGNLYKCLQDHTSQDIYPPDISISQWKKVGDDAGEEYPQWSQPIGAGDAYMKGDKVSFNEKHYVSTIDNNVWQPGVYGWEEVA